MDIEFVDSTFDGVQVVLDNTSYVRCQFLRCEIVYRGGPFHLDGCNFDAPNFRFEDAAARTVEFLKGMYGVPGGEAYFDALFPKAPPTLKAKLH